MYTTSIKYDGELRTISKHNYSGSNLITDAPIDNMGKGEGFSPTDLVVTALGSCILTIMGIYCQKNNLKFEAASIDVLKVMGSNPRRISKIDLNLNVKNAVTTGAQGIIDGFKFSKTDIFSPKYSHSALLFHAYIDTISTKRARKYV